MSNKENRDFYTISLSGQNPNIIIQDYGEFDTFFKSLNNEEDLDCFKLISSSHPSNLLSCEDLYPYKGLIINNIISQSWKETYSMNFSSNNIRFNKTPSQWSLIKFNTNNDLINYASSIFYNRVDSSNKIKCNNENELREYIRINSIYIGAKEIALNQKLDIFKLSYSPELICSKKFKQENEKQFEHLLSFSPFEDFKINVIK